MKCIGLLGYLGIVAVTIRIRNDKFGRNIMHYLDLRSIDLDMGYICGRTQHEQARQQFFWTSGNVTIERQYINIYLYVDKKTITIPQFYITNTSIFYHILKSS